VIFIKGAESHYIQPEDQRLISEIFPNFELFEIPQASHWAQADQPFAFMEVINSIL
jgi:pimeloyl-ACP methyl ester carboxylesterase